jgi:hypothetical protein
MNRAFLVFFTLSMTLTAPSSSAEVIDRILAVVEGQIITLSDARAALRLDLVPADVSEDPIAAVMQRLIDRRLMLAEVERYAPAEPPASAIDARLASIQARFKDALGLEIALNQTAMTREELQRHIRDTLRIDAYLQQRLSITVEPSPDDMQRYYREHPAELTADGVLRPFAEVAERIRARLIEERRDPIVREWIEGLRRRGNVVIVYLPGRG